MGDTAPDDSVRFPSFERADSPALEEEEEEEEEEKGDVFGKVMLSPAEGEGTLIAGATWPWEDDEEEEETGEEGGKQQVPVRVP